MLKHTVQRSSKGVDVRAVPASAERNEDDGGLSLQTAASLEATVVGVGLTLLRLIGQLDKFVLVPNCVFIYNPKRQ